MKSLIVLALASAAALSAAPVTIYLELGVGAEGVEPWGGSIRLSAGRIVSLEGRHFSAQDSVIGAERWQTATRREQIEGFARVNYNEMSPAELPPTQYSPVGVWATIDAPESARVTVATEQGELAFRLDQLTHQAKPFLDGRVLASLAPSVEKLTTEEHEDDEPAIATLSDGSLAVAWVGYKDRADRIFVRTSVNGVWSAPEEATPSPGDLWRVSLAADSQGGLWVFWAQRDGAQWDLWGRRKANGSWSAAQKISADGSSTFHRAAGMSNGHVVVAWQSFRGDGMEAQSDIYARRWDGSSWGAETRLSDSKANDWEPFVAAGPGGEAFVVWDGYEDGNYDIFFRSFAAEPGPLRRITRAPASRRTPPSPPIRKAAVGGLGGVRPELGQGPGLSDHSALGHTAAPGAHHCGGHVGRRPVADAQEAARTVLRLPPVPQSREPSDRIRRPRRAEHGLSALDPGSSPQHRREDHVGELPDAL